MIQYPGSTPFNPQAMFPTFQPGPSSIDTRYTPGGVSTTTQAPGVPMSSGPYQQLAAMLPQMQGAPAPKRGFGAKAATSTGPSRRGQSMHKQGPQRMEENEMTIRSAAMRPVGLGAQMIPGMQEDTRLLPRKFWAEKSELKPGDRVENAAAQSAAGGQGFSGPAGLGGAMQQANALQSSNSGFAYLPPAEQDRYLAALQRSNSEQAKRSR